MRKTKPCSILGVSILTLSLMLAGCANSDNSTTLDTTVGNFNFTSKDDSSANLDTSTTVDDNTEGIVNTDDSNKTSMDTSQNSSEETTSIVADNTTETTTINENASSNNNNIPTIEDATTKPNSTIKPTDTKPTTTKPTDTKPNTKPSTEKETTTKSNQQPSVPPEREIYSANANKLAKQVINKIVKSNMTELQKAMVIYQWIADNFNGYGTSIYPEDALNGKSIGLEGCTHLFKILADNAGLQAICIKGEALSSIFTYSPYYWNQVKIDGKWYNVDSYVDAYQYQSVKGSELTTHMARIKHYNCFLISDDLFYQTVTDNSGIPCQ